MAPAAHLRLLNLCIKHQVNDAIHKKFLFLIQNLSQKSVNLWVSSVEAGGLSSDDQFVYDIKNQTLSCGDQNLVLSAKPAFREILELLQGENEIPLPKAIKLLWNGDESEANISRLRMRVRRLNSEIEKVFGRKDFIKLSTSDLALTFSLIQSEDKGEGPA